jgi:hypothetical protein
VGPRAGLEVVARRKIINLCRESNPVRPDCNLVNILTERTFFVAIKGKGKIVPVLN